jgi:hypothetical protein
VSGRRQEPFRIAPGGPMLVLPIASRHEEGAEAERAERCAPRDEHPRDHPDREWSAPEEAEPPDRDQEPGDDEGHDRGPPIDDRRRHTPTG